MWLVVGQTDEHLADIRARQQAEECVDGVVQVVDDGLLRDELAGPQPVGDLLLELRPQIFVVPHDETMPQSATRPCTFNANKAATN